MNRLPVDSLPAKEMREIRCPDCHRLLFKGNLFEVEIKCPKCHACHMMVSDGQRLKSCRCSDRRRLKRE